MSKKQRELDEFQMQNSLRPEEPEYDILRKKTIKELIAPSLSKRFNLARVKNV